jgi:hypothetical protein
MRTLSLGGGCTFMTVQQDPSIGPIDDKAYDGKIVATEAGGLLPNITVAEKADDRDGMSQPGLRASLLDFRFDEANANFVGGFRHFSTPSCCQVRLSSARIQNYSSPFLRLLVA